MRKGVTLVTERSDAARIQGCSRGAKLGLS